jgi:hypothetical protein
MGFLEGLLRTSQQAPTNFFGSLSKGLDRQGAVELKAVQEQMRQAQQKGDWRTVQEILTSQDTPQAFTAGRNERADSLMLEQMQAKDIAGLPSSQLTGQGRMPKPTLEQYSEWDTDPDTGDVSERIMYGKAVDDITSPTGVRHESTGIEADSNWGDRYEMELVRQSQAAQAAGLKDYLPGAIERAEPYLEERFTRLAKAEGIAGREEIYKMNTERRKGSVESRAAAKGQYDANDEARKVDQHRWAEEKSRRELAKAGRDATEFMTGQDDNIRGQWTDLSKTINTDGRVKNFKVTQVNYLGVMRMVGEMLRTNIWTNVGPEQIAVFNLFQRTIDPATVREGDIALQRSSMGVLEQAKIYLQNITEGQVFNKKFGESILRAMTNLYDIQQREVQAYLNNTLDAGAVEIRTSDGLPVSMIHPSAIRAVRLQSKHLTIGASELTSGMSDRYMGKPIGAEEMPMTEVQTLIEMTADLQKYQSEFGDPTNPKPVPSHWGRAQLDYYKYLMQSYGQEMQAPAEEPGVFGGFFN